MFKRIWGFVKNVAKAAFNFVKKTAIDVVNNVETAVSMSVEAVGWTAILSSLPFMIAMPMWIEGTLVIPVISVAIVLFLSTLAVYRHEHGLIIGA